MKPTIIDLTHALNAMMPVYPGTYHPVFESFCTIEKDGFAETRMTMVTHTGTHLDAPSHLIKGAKSLDEFPAEKFVGNAIVIDCISKKEIDLSILSSVENKIALVDFVLFHTGWSKKWNSPEYFDGFPVLSQDAAQWLAGFNLKGIGFDAISADKVSSEDLPNHHILLEKEIIIIENLTNLDKLPSGIFTVQCLPLKIEKADGSPVRAIATIRLICLLH